MDQALPKPYSNRDFDFFYAGLKDRQLLVQKCSACGALRNPPGPMCPHCRALAWEPLALAGAGTVYSYTVHHHPPLPGFGAPHAMVLVEMAEGVRVFGALAPEGQAGLRIGMPVRVEFLRAGDTPTFRFLPAS